MHEVAKPRGTACLNYPNFLLPPANLGDITGDSDESSPKLLNFFFFFFFFFF